MLLSLALWAVEEGQPVNQGPPGNPLWTFAPFILIMIVFWFMIMRPAQKRERMQRETLLSSLKKNDRVLTSGGLIGVVALVNDKEDELVLKVDESANVRLRVLKSSVVRNYTAEENAAKEKEAAAAQKDQAVPAKG